MNEAANNKLIGNLSEKSKDGYKKSYDKFVAWKSENKHSSLSENILLEYFKELHAKHKPSSLWTEYSKIKAMLRVCEQTDISTYPELLIYLRNISKGYQAKKFKTFSEADVEKFITEAPDQAYLLYKVAVIFGVTGACSRQELQRLKYKDVRDSSKFKTLTVYIMTKGKIDRIFYILKYYDICKKYLSLRPKCKSTNFFLRYHNGACNGHNVGINTFRNMGKVVADYLKLPNSELYTGHCLRRTARLVKREDIGAGQVARVHMVPLSQLQEQGVPAGAGTSRKRSSPAWCASDDSSDSNPPEPVDPLGLEQCRFCREFTKDCVKVTSEKPYLVNNRTAFALNGVSVDVDFSDDTLPKSVCRNCDEKLQDIYDFVTQVQRAQVPLINSYVAEENDDNETVVINEPSPTPEGNDTKLGHNEDNDTKEGIVESVTVGETEFVKLKYDVFTHKRKNDNQISESDKDAKKPKPIVVNKDIGKQKELQEECETNELIIDIKEEIIEKDVNSETDKGVNNETDVNSETQMNFEVSDSDKGSEEPSELEMATRALLNNYLGDQI